MIRKKQSVHKAIILAMTFVLVIGVVTKEKALASSPAVFINEKQLRSLARPAPTFPAGA